MKLNDWVVVAGQRPKLFLAQVTSIHLHNESVTVKTKEGDVYRYVPMRTCLKVDYRPEPPREHPHVM